MGRARGNTTFLHEKCNFLRKEGNKQHGRMNQKQLNYFSLRVVISAEIIM